MCLYVCVVYLCSLVFNSEVAGTSQGDARNQTPPASPGSSVVVNGDAEHQTVDGQATGIASITVSEERTAGDGQESARLNIHK